MSAARQWVLGIWRGMFTAAWVGGVFAAPEPVKLVAEAPAPAPGQQVQPASSAERPSFENPSAGPRPDAPVRPIDQLVADLDHNSYFARELATRQLMAHGKAAVEPMLKTVRSGSLEASSRAVNVLKLIGMSPDLATEDAAYEALAKVAEGKSAVAQRAAESLKYLKETRQDRTLARLREMGGKSSAPYSATALGMRRVVVGGAGLVVVGPGGAVVEEGDGNELVAVTIGPDWKGGRDGLKLLSRLGSLYQLLLEGPQVTDEWLADLSTMRVPGLQELSLKRTKTSGEALAAIAKLGDLTSVDILYAPVTDEQLGELTKLKKLQSVRLYGTRVTTDGARALQEKLPDCRVDRRGGALLGVSGSSADDGCTINYVTPDSAAAKAGIRQGDLVVDFDGRKVANFTELTAAIADKTGGDRVRITLEREGKPLQVTVELGEW